MRKTYFRQKTSDLFSSCHNLEFRTKKSYWNKKHAFEESNCKSAETRSLCVEPLSSSNKPVRVFYHEDVVLFFQYPASLTVKHVGRKESHSIELGNDFASTVVAAFSVPTLEGTEQFLLFFQKGSARLVVLGNKNPTFVSSAIAQNLTTRIAAKATHFSTFRRVCGETVAQVWNVAHKTYLFSTSYNRLGLFGLFANKVFYLHTCVFKLAKYRASVFSGNNVFFAVHKRGFSYNFITCETMDVNLSYSSESRLE